MTEKFAAYDTADFLRSKAEIDAYLEAAAAENDAAFMVTALATVARAQNMAALARRTGMTRAGLYKSLSPQGNPSFATVARIADELGFRLEFKRVKAKS